MTKLNNLPLVTLARISSFLSKGVGMYVCSDFALMHKTYGCKICRAVHVGNSVCICGLVRQTKRRRVITALAIGSSIDIDRLVLYRDERRYMCIMRKTLYLGSSPYKKSCDMIGQHITDLDFKDTLKSLATCLSG